MLLSLFVSFFLSHFSSSTVPLRPVCQRAPYSYLCLGVLHFVFPMGVARCAPLLDFRELLGHDYVGTFRFRNRVTLAPLHPKRP